MLRLPVAHDRLPYFFSDQYDLGLECAGYVPPSGSDAVVFRAGARPDLARLSDPGVPLSDVLATAG